MQDEQEYRNRPNQAKIKTETIIEQNDRVDSQEAKAEQEEPGSEQISVADALQSSDAELTIQTKTEEHRIENQKEALLESELQQEHDENDQEKDEVDEIAQNEYKEKSLSYQQPNKCIYYPPPGCVIIPYDKDEYEAKKRRIQAQIDTLMDKIQQTHQNVLGFRTQNYLRKSLDELRFSGRQDYMNNMYNSRQQQTNIPYQVQSLANDNEMIGGQMGENSFDQQGILLDTESNDILENTEEENQESHENNSESSSVETQPETEIETEPKTEIETEPKTETKKLNAIKPFKFRSLAAGHRETPMQLHSPEQSVQSSLRPQLHSALPPILHNLPLRKFAHVSLNKV